MIKASLALSVLLSAPAVLALIPADVLLQRNRTSHVLSRPQRDVAKQFAADFSITGTPEEYREKLTATYPALSAAPAFMYYAGVSHLEVREHVLEAYVTRRDQSKKAVKALQDYLRRCHERLRPADRADAFMIRAWPGPAEPADPPFDFKVEDKGIHVYHYLPYPEHLEASLAERAENLAEADLEHCRHDQEHVEEARQKYLESHVFWLRWLDKEGKVIADRSESALKSEVPSDPLPTGESPVKLLPRDGTPQP